MYDLNRERLNEIMNRWGFPESEAVERYNPDSPRVVAKIRADDRFFILKGISDTRDSQPRDEKTIQGNVSVHRFLGNQKGIAPKIYQLKDKEQDFCIKKDGYWFYLLEYIEGRQMERTVEDEFLLGKLARQLNSYTQYSFPSSQNEDKQRFYGWFEDKEFKPQFDNLLNHLPDFGQYDRCLIHTDLGPHNAIVRTDGTAALIDLDDAGIGSRYLDIGWAFIMQFVEHTEDMCLSYRFDLAQSFLKGYYDSEQITKKEYDLIWHGAVYTHISYMQSYGPYAVDSLWKILQYGLAQKPLLWKMINGA